jgi:hypothetical protein
MLLFGYVKERNWTALFGYALFAGMLAVGYSYPGLRADFAGCRRSGGCLPDPLRAGRVRARLRPGGVGFLGLSAPLFPQPVCAWATPQP